LDFLPDPRARLVVAYRPPAGFYTPGAVFLVPLKCPCFPSGVELRPPFPGRSVLMAPIFSEPVLSFYPLPPVGMIVFCPRSELAVAIIFSFTHSLHNMESRFQRRLMSFCMDLLFAPLFAWSLSSLNPAFQISQLNSIPLPSPGVLRFVKQTHTDPLPLRFIGPCEFQAPHGSGYFESILRISCFAIYRDSTQRLGALLCFVCFLLLFLFRNLPSRVCSLGVAFPTLPQHTLFFPLSFIIPLSFSTPCAKSFLSRRSTPDGVFPPIPR